MRQQVYILYNEYTEHLADKIADTVFINQKILSEDLSPSIEVLYHLASITPTEYFYVIKCVKEMTFPDFDFTYIPTEWDTNYIHIWNNDPNLLMFRKDNVLDNLSSFSKYDLKNIEKQAIEYPNPDIVFISYDETYADENYNYLYNLFPRTKRVKGVNGIFNAHKAAAALAETEMFYVVDADAKVMETFRFNHPVFGMDNQTVHVWTSKNPINDLEYGYGGIKLFPTKMLRDYTGSPVDFTTSVSEHFKVIPEVSNITNFNTDPYSTWRSAFRECVKLSSGIMPGTDTSEVEQRLGIWCTIGAEREFGEFAIMGAKEGTHYGKEYSNDVEKLKLINDYKWLETKFRES